MPPEMFASVAAPYVRALEALEKRCQVQAMEIEQLTKQRDAMAAYISKLEEASKELLDVLDAEEEETLVRNADIML